MCVYRYETLIWLMFRIGANKSLLLSVSSLPSPLWIIFPLSNFTGHWQHGFLFLFFFLTWSLKDLVSAAAEIVGGGVSYFRSK